MFLSDGSEILVPASGRTAAGTQIKRARLPPLDPRLAPPAGRPLRPVRFEMAQTRTGFTTMDEVVRNPSLPGASGRVVVSGGMGPETPRAARMAGGETRAIPPEVMDSIESGLSGLGAADGGGNNSRLLFAAGGLFLAYYVLRRTRALEG